MIRKSPESTLNRVNSTQIARTKTDAAPLHLPPTLAATASLQRRSGGDRALPRRAMRLVARIFWVARLGRLPRGM
jgi:hypothetical protein